MSVSAGDRREEDSDPVTNGTGHELRDDERLFQVVDAYLRELEQGRRPDRHEWLARYPELAPALGRCLDSLGFVHEAVASLSQPRQSALPVGSGLPAGGAIGDFQIIREIGRGGMGLIYEAVQLSLGRRVALKVLPFAAGLDEKHLQRFRQESQAAAQLHHNNIVPVFAIGCERGVHFYAMQLIDGLSLDRIIDRLRCETAAAPAAADADSRFPVRAATDLVSDMAASEPGAGWPMSPQPLACGPAAADAASLEQTLADLSGDLSTQQTRARASVYRAVARLMVQAAEALDYAHRQGIIHRDIKPANLMLDKQRTLWITDFGLAHLHGEENLTRTGELLGTIRYASPEQLSGQRALLDQRADLYSLGATFYELVTLRPVFAADTRQALLNQVLNLDPVRPRTFDRRLPVELETILLKLLSKSPAERYGSARELADDLQRFLRDEPLSARPPSLLERLRKWGRRHPAHVGAAVIVMFVVLLISALSNWLIAQANSRVRAAWHQERLRADEAEARFSQARQAVDLLIELSEHDLADKPPLQPLQRQVLEAALVFYQDFVAQHRGNPSREAELIAVQRRLRKVLDELLVLEGAGQLLLLAERDVQADLALAPADAQQIDAIARQFLKQSQGLLQEYRQLTPDARRAALLDLARTNEHLANSILDERQRQRLEQIRMQVMGFHVFNEPKIVKALKLTDAQRQAFRSIELETLVWMNESPEPADEATRQDRHDRLSQRALNRTLALLTPEQSSHWRELTGPPFQGHLANRPPGAPPTPPGI